MDTSEILFKGEAIGQLLVGPNDEMVIEYMPYRSGVHYEFVRALERKEDTNNAVEIGIDGDRFTVIEIIRPHFMRVLKVAMPSP